MKEIKLIDTTIRDGNQSLWATRMTTAMILPSLEKLDRAGFLHLDVNSALHVDVCVRFLKENPFDRARLMKKYVGATPMRMGFRSGNITGFSTRLPPDFIDLWVGAWRNVGFSVFWCHDGLIDLNNMGANIGIVKKHGGIAIAPLTFTESPVHTDEFYASKTGEVIKKFGADVIMIKDSAGLLTVDRVRTLVPAIRAAAGSVPVEIHSHCLTGLAPLVCLEAVKLGINRVHVAIGPLANGASLPSARTMIRNLRTLGYSVNVDEAIVDDLTEYFTRVADRTGKPHGAPVEYDAFHYEHQIPGGMLTNFKVQLEEAGMLEKLDEVLDEVSRVRVELGWLLMVTPFAQLIGVQAMLNVISGERYKVVPDEIKRYALGHYGLPAAPIDPNVLDKILSNGSQSIKATLQESQPVVPELRRRYPRADDEELVLRYLFESVHLDAMRAAGPIPTDDPRLSATQPLMSLMSALTERPSLRRIKIQKGKTMLELRQ
jgi:oxaloacetate decarboxylase (Na+ extruding) subunit alpha